MENIYSTQEALELAKEIYTADEIGDTKVGEFIEKAPAEDLVLARIPLRNAEECTKVVKNHAENFIRKDVENRGTFKLNDTVFHSTKPYKYEVLDLPNFFRWLLGDVEEDKIGVLCAIVGSKFIPKLRALDTISEMRGKNPQPIRDTFLARNIDDESRLLIINCSSASAPKWAVNMEEGERFERS